MSLNISKYNIRIHRAHTGQWAHEEVLNIIIHQRNKVTPLHNHEDSQNQNVRCQPDWQGWGETGTLTSCWWGRKMMQTHQETVQSTQEPAQRRSCSMIQKGQKEGTPQISTNIQMDKQVWYVHTTEYYLVIKRNKALTRSKTDGTWKLMSSERSHKRPRHTWLCSHGSQD